MIAALVEARRRRVALEDRIAKVLAHLAIGFALEAFDVVQLRGDVAELLVDELTLEPELNAE